MTKEKKPDDENVDSDNEVTDNDNMIVTGSGSHVIEKDDGSVGVGTEDDCYDMWLTYQIMRSEYCFHLQGLVLGHHWCDWLMIKWKW